MAFARWEQRCMDRPGWVTTSSPPLRAQCHSLRARWPPRPPHCRSGARGVDFQESRAAGEGCLGVTLVLQDTLLFGGE